MNTEIDNNLDKIKSQIKNGNTTSIKTMTDGDELHRLHDKHLFLKGIQNLPSKQHIYRANLAAFETDLQKLARRLNEPFVIECTTNRILEVLAFDEYLEQKLSKEEFNIYNALLKNNFSFEQLKESLGGKTCNAYHSLATLNGFKDMTEYMNAETKKQAMFEEKARLGREKQERIDEMKQAYKEALKEHKEGI